RDPLVFLRNIKALLLQVRVKLALRLVIRVGNVVPNLRSLAGYLTNSCHSSVVLVRPFGKGTANIGKLRHYPNPGFRNFCCPNPAQTAGGHENSLDASFLASRPLKSSTTKSV